MIFKITIHDNDFTQHLETMCQRCGVNLLWDMPKPDNFETLTPSQQCDLYEEEWKFRKWCNVNTLDLNKLKPEEITQLEERVKINTLRYLKKYQSKDYKYYEDNLKVKFLKSFKVRWENGENVYYFPFNCGKWLSQ